MKIIFLIILLYPIITCNFGDFLDDIEQGKVIVTTQILDLYEVKGTD